MNLPNLITRVEGLDKPDREVELELWRLFNPERADKVPLPWLFCVTESIDAVVALIEQKLPGWMRSVMTGCGKTVAHVRDKSILCEDKVEGSGYSSIEACALLAAFLRAYERTLSNTGERRDG